VCKRNEEENVEYSVFLRGYGQRILAIKAVYAMPGGWISWTDARNLVDRLSDGRVRVASGVSREDADAIRDHFKMYGCSVWTEAHL
jgi:ribosomal protein L7/L12